MQNRWMRMFLGKWALTAVALTGFVALAGVPKLHADDDCQRRIAHADHRLHEAVEHYGYQSREAAEARHELHEEREHLLENEQSLVGRRSAPLARSARLG